MTTLSQNDAEALKAATLDLPVDRHVPRRSPRLSESDDGRPEAAEITDIKSLSVQQTPFAQGTYADVYEGEWTPPDRDEKIKVAVKILRFNGMHVNMPGGYEDVLKRIDKRLSREMFVWQRICHPRITPLLGFLRHASDFAGSDKPCLVSPYKENGNLKTYLIKHPTTDRLKLLQQAAEGLNYLHTQVPKIAHLDVKPENILIDTEGNAELCDFGLAKVLDDVSTGFTTSTGNGGTLPYMSPEVLEGAKGGTPADIYAFAGLILQTLSGQPPFYQYPKGRVVLLVAQGQTAERHNHQIDAPNAALDAIWKVLKECWAKDPNRRPDSQKLLEGLSEIRRLWDAKEL
ncbi:hypothetical protein FRB99_008689 [Tulasnella sp. 403]|nr:hypothetical protein FRB99_008689 [Tulasnella sp. 403]